jgi:hypothetical protein
MKVIYKAESFRSKASSGTRIFRLDILTEGMDPSRMPSYTVVRERPWSSMNCFGVRNRTGALAPAVSSMYSSFAGGLISAGVYATVT